MKTKSLTFQQYQEVMKLSHNQFCRYMDSMMEIASQRAIEVAEENIREQILHGADEAYVMDVDELYKRIISVRGVTAKMAGEIVAAIITE